MKAKLLPLEGKYYATQIEIVDDGWGSTIELHMGGYGEPSDRELERMGCTRKEYRECTYPSYELGYDGSHYESKVTHNIAQKVVKAINSYEEPKDSSD